MPKVTCPACGRFVGGKRADFHGLLPRQWQIAERIHKGLSDKEIAVEMRLAYSTVQSQVREILGHWFLERRSQIILKFEQIKRSHPSL